MKTTLNPGEYIVIDPCYIFPDNEWSDFCNCSVYELEKEQGNVKSKYPYMGRFAHSMFYKEREFYVFPTAYGDGGYSLMKGGESVGEMSVDAGLLSLIPLELAKTWPEFEENKHLGAIVKLEKSVTLAADNKGNFKFGEYSVKTD